MAEVGGIVAHNLKHFINPGRYIGTITYFYKTYAVSEERARVMKNVSDSSSRLLVSPYVCMPRAIVPLRGISECP